MSERFEVEVYAYGKKHQSVYVQRLFFLILIQKIRTKHIEKWYTNQEVGSLFGLDYSSISRRVTIRNQIYLKKAKFIND